MTMKFCYVVVEGQTEESFIKTVLSPNLETKNIQLTPVIVKTSRDASGKKNKGGGKSYIKYKNDIEKLLNISNAVCVTTMIDFYGLPSDFPTYKTQSGDCYSRVAQLEDACKKDIDHPKFLPYFSLHEFEALLFSAPDVMQELLIDIPDKDKPQLKMIRNQFQTPEEINDQHPPSKRLERLTNEAYKKVFHGTIIALDIPLDIIRAECRHFDEWVTKLEGL